MEIQNLLKSPYKLKMFFIYLTIGLIALLLINFMLLPYIFNNAIPSLEKILTDITTNLSTLVATSIVTTLFLFLVTPKVVNESDINIISPHDLKDTLSNITNNTDFFTYYGHTARWNRSVTLPKLLQESNSDHSTKKIDIIVIDPDNEQATLYYSNFGHGTRVYGNKINTQNDVKLELFITILTLFEYQQNPFLDITVYLSSNISLFRMDLTENALILTKPYSEEPALLFYKDSFFYKSYKEEINIAKEQSKKLVFPKNNKQEINKESCRRILKQMHFNIDMLIDEDINTIINGIKNNIKPY